MWGVWLVFMSVYFPHLFFILLLFMPLISFVTYSKCHLTSNPEEAFRSVTCSCSDWAWSNRFVGARTGAGSVQSGRWAWKYYVHCCLWAKVGDCLVSPGAHVSLVPSAALKRAGSNFPLFLLARIGNRGSLDRNMYIFMNTNSPYSDPEDGGSIINTAHILIVQQSNRSVLCISRLRLP